MFKSGHIVQSISQPSKNCVLVSSESQSYLLSVDSTSRMNDIMVVNCKSHIEDLQILNDRRLCMSICEGGQAIQIGVLRGPEFGQKFK